MRVTLAEFIAAAGTAAILGWMADDSLVALCLAVLFIGLKLVQTDDNLLILSAAFAFQWMQTSVGVLYKGVFNREVATIYSSNYRPMVMIGLGCCLALAVGIRLGLTAVRTIDQGEERPSFAFTLRTLVVVYVITVFFEGSLILDFVAIPDRASDSGDRRYSAPRRSVSDFPPAPDATTALVAVRDGRGY